jgi:hypothetical protein
MRYFIYSPLNMSETEAYEAAQQFLDEKYIVHVRSPFVINFIDLPKGTRPQALPDTYLVRVEPDGSLRTVQRALS